MAQSTVRRGQSVPPTAVRAPRAALGALRSEARRGD